MSPSEGRRRRSSALSEIWKSTASSRLPVSPELRRRRFGIFSLKLMGVISIVFATIVAATTVTSSSRWTGSGASLRKFSSLHRLIIPEHHRLSSTPIAGIIRTTTGMVGLSSKCSRSSVNRHRGVASLSCGAKPGGGGGGGSGGAKRRRGGGANGDGDPNSKARNRRRSMGDSEAASRNRQPSSGGADRRRPMWDEEDEDGVSFGAAPGGNRERRRNRRKSVGGGGSNSQQSREARMAGLLDELFDDIERLQDSESRGASTNNVVDSNDKHNYDNDDDDHELEEEDLTKVNLSSDQLRAIGGINGQEWAESWEREKAALDDRGKEAVSVISAVAGTPEAVDRLREFSDVLSVPVLAAAFPFELDDYQLQSIRTILRNESLVLSAPTGAGKTVAGEAAVFAALAQNRRAFYTTPLKALSNQKFLDLSESLGAERVGLSTGDVRHNVDAEVVVMTTEVYRNMLYSRDNKNNPGAKSSSSTTANSAAAVEGEEAAVSSETEHSSSSPSSSVESSVASGVEPVEGGGEGGVVFEDQGRLESVFAVVLDEFHYMNDADRGTVWEESVINSPPWVSLVALSATMANAMDVKQWISKVHGPCELVLSDNRPVPLRFAYCDRWGILPLMQGPKALRGKSFFTQNPVESELAQGNKPRAQGFSRGEKKRSRGENRLNSEIISRESRKKREFMKNAKGDEAGALRRFRRAQTPPMGLVIRELRKNKLLPGIVFIFSRKGCEEAAMDVVAHVDSLTSEREKEEITRRLELFEARSPGIVNPERKWMVLEGVATHHAGLLPVWKAFIEELFQEGLLKAVFATETLAAGINMPARTTVISALARRRGEGVDMLTSSELRQMAGRAGRRGKDTVGFSVLLKSRFRGAQEAHAIVRKLPEALKSKFTPTYGMVLNLLSKHSVDEAKTIVANSFGSYLRARRQSKREDRQQKQVEMAEEIVKGIDPDAFLAYNKLRHRLKDEKRALGFLIDQSRDMFRESVAEMLQWAPVGTPVLIPSAADNNDDKRGGGGEWK